MVDIIISWVSDKIAGLLDEAIAYFAPLLGFSFQTFVNTFPYANTVYLIFQRCALAIVLVIAVVHLWNWLFPSNPNSRVSPIRAAYCVILAIGFIYFGNYLLEGILDLCIYPYEAIISGTSDKGLSVNVSMGTLLADAFGGLTMLLNIILFIMIGIAFVKLMLEAVERYIVLFLLVYASPLAAATLASDYTSSIYKKFFTMFISQCILMILNIWILKLCISMFENLGAQSEKALALLLGWGLLKVGSRLDSYINQLGLNAAVTGMGLAAEIGAVAGGLLAAGGRATTGGKGAGNGLMGAAKKFVSTVDKYNPMSMIGLGAKNYGGALLKSTIGKDGLVGAAINKVKGNPPAAKGTWQENLKKNMKAATMKTQEENVWARAMGGKSKNAAAAHFSAENGSTKTGSTPVPSTHGSNAQPLEHTNVPVQNENVTMIDTDNSSFDASHSTVGPMGQVDDMSIAPAAGMAVMASEEIGPAGSEPEAVPVVQSDNASPNAEPTESSGGRDTSTHTSSGQHTASAVERAISSTEHNTSFVPVHIENPASANREAGKDTKPETRTESERKNGIAPDAQKPEHNQPHTQNLKPASVQPENTQTTNRNAKPVNAQSEPSPTHGSDAEKKTQRSGDPTKTTVVPTAGTPEKQRGPDTSASTERKSTTANTSVESKAPTTAETTASKPRGESGTTKPNQTTAQPHADAVVSKDRENIAKYSHIADHIFQNASVGKAASRDAANVGAVMQGIGFDKTHQGANEFVSAAYGNSHAKNADFKIDKDGITASYDQDGKRHKANIIGAAQYDALPYEKRAGFTEFKSDDGSKYYYKTSTQLLPKPPTEAQAAAADFSAKAQSFVSNTGGTMASKDYAYMAKHPETVNQVFDGLQDSGVTIRDQQQVGYMLQAMQTPDVPSRAKSDAVNALFAGEADSAAINSDGLSVSYVADDGKRNNITILTEKKISELGADYVANRGYTMKNVDGKQYAFLHEKGGDSFDFERPNKPKK